MCESFPLVCCSSGHALNRPAEDDTTPVDDVNVKVTIGSFVLFFTTYGGNADLVYSNGAVLPIVVLLHLFNAVPEAHPHIKAIVLSIVETSSGRPRLGNRARDQRRRVARIGTVLRSHNQARTEARRSRYVAAIAAPPYAAPLSPVLSAVAPPYAAPPSSVPPVPLSNSPLLASEMLHDVVVNDGCRFTQ